MISFLKKKKKTITVCDFETGGLNPNKHAITEVAMLNFDMETLKVNWEYQAYIQTYHNLEVSKSSLEKSLVSQNDIDNYQSLQTAVTEAEEELNSQSDPGDIVITEEKSVTQKDIDAYASLQTNLVEAETNLIKL